MLIDFSEVRNYLYGNIVTDSISAEQLLTYFETHTCVFISIQTSEVVSWIKFSTLDSLSTSSDADKI